VRERRVWSDALLARPWILVLVVAVFVALPVLVLGQASENDTRVRLKQAHVANASQAATTISMEIAARVFHVRDTLNLLALNPTPETSLLGTAVQHKDRATLQALADAVAQSNVSSVLRVYVAQRGEELNIVNARIVAVAPPNDELLGRRLSDLRDARGAALGAAVGSNSAATPGGTSVIYENTAGPATGIAIAAGVRGDPRATLTGSASGATGPATADALATIVAELDLPRLFTAAALPSLAATDDAYLIRDDLRLVGRARGPVERPLRDLGVDPFIQLAHGSSSAVRTDVPDPLGGGPRVLASATVHFLADNSLASFVSTRVVVARDTSVIDRETDTVLAQLAAARYVLVTLLLAGAYLVAVASGQRARSSVDRERLRLARDLHDLLGRSLSVIAIKSQLARRLAPAGEISRAVDEIGDVERIARESLQDVRQAVDGYRQPSVMAELATGRSALVAAGIAATVDESVGALDPRIDAALAWAIREGVTNVIRHGHAATCEIRLTRLNGDARLEIVNDGPTASVVVTGNGLRGLRERAADRGGSADAGPLPGGGFRLRVTLPLRAP
jgi:signal transduction histidine kinase